MALRDKLAERSRPHLEPGEQIQQVFLGQTGPSPWLSVLTYLLIFWVKFRIVAVTDRRIVVLASKKMIMTPTGEIVASLPRTTRLGPVAGLWARVEATGERMYVHKRFHKDVDAADAAIGAAGDPGAPERVAGFETPAGWYPDPSGGGQSRYWDGRAWTDRTEETPTS